MLSLIKQSVSWLTPLSLQLGPSSGEISGHSERNIKNTMKYSESRKISPTADTSCHEGLCVHGRSRPQRKVEAENGKGDAFRVAARLS